MAAPLPTLLSSFVGRAAEIDEVSASIQASWLTSIVGPGGAGKTRLAIEVARRCADRYEHGVRFCDLATVSAPEAALESICTTLQVRPGRARTQIDAVVESLLGRHTLLVLDNCEHVLDPLLELMAGIGTGARTVDILATSRERLGVAGEQTVRLGPLREGVELFTDRVSAGGVDVSHDDLTLIERVCARVDGLPLAIELVAAKHRTMTLPEIERRLDDMLDLLPPTDRSTDDRHGTLESALAWSYRHLDERERALFEQLVVFAGPFELDAVLAIAGESADDDVEIEHRLSTLLDKSLLTVDLTGSSSRFRLLETMRQFGRSRVPAALALDLGRRHMTHYHRRIVAEAAVMRGRGGPRAYSWFRDNWADIRQATAWATRNGDIDRAADLVASGHEFGWWCARAEVGQWAERLLAAGSDDIRVHGTVAFWKALAGDIVGQVEHVKPLLEAVDWEKTAQTSWLWTNYASGVSMTERGPAALAAVVGGYEANKLASKGQQAHWAGAIASLLAPTDPDGALERITETRELIATGQVPPHWQVNALSFAARACGLLGRRNDAVEFCRRALDVATEHDVVFGRIFAAGTLALLAGLDAVDDPRAAFHDALSTAVDAGDWYGTWPILKDLARWLDANGEPADARVIREHLAAYGLWTGGSTQASPQTERSASPRAATSVPLAREDLIAFVFTRLAARGDERDEGQAPRPAIVLLPDGAHAEVTWAGTRANVRNLVGVGYLQRLLEAPDDEISATALVGGGRAAELSTQPLLDTRARTAIEARSLELVRQLERARRAGRHDRVARLEDEIEQLTETLTRATGLGGRHRAFPDADERARSAAGKAIRRAINEIGGHLPEAADHLRAHVTTGRTCCYHRRPGTR